MLIVHLCQHWKHMMILRKVVIDFIAIICIMYIIGFKRDLSLLDQVLFTPEFFLPMLY